MALGRKLSILTLASLSVVASGCEQSAERGAAAQAPPPDFTLTAENTHSKFSRSIAPTLTVPSGSVVEVQTKEATDGQLTVDSDVSALATLDFDRIHALTGPIFVEGAEPGDVLEVKLHSFEVADWGWAAVIAGFGFLADEFPDAHLKTFRLGAGAQFAEFNDRIRIPLAPFAGVMGVAPDTDSMLTTIPPRANGGNMDNRYLTAGTTVYLPVQVPGALFSIGDPHAAQGDGEVSGTAIEAPLRIVLELAVRKDMHAIAEPQYETEEYYAVTGFAPTIDEAARKATRYMIDYLVNVHGLERVEAYMLCSFTADLKISETVDVPNMLVSMHIPKSVLGM